MLLGFDFTSWYATTIYVFGGVLVLVAAAEKLYGWSRWLHRKVRPEPLIPPPVSIGEQISAVRSYAQDEGEPTRHLAWISPRYEIRNDGPDYAIRDVTTGVRRRDRPGDYQFDWHRPDIPPLTHRTVEGVEIPPKMFRDVHESVAQEAFVFWARFLAAGGRWEVTRDAHTKQAGEQFNPPPLERPGSDTSRGAVKPSARPRI